MKKTIFLLSILLANLNILAWTPWQKLTTAKSITTSKQTPETRLPSQQYPSIAKTNNLAKKISKQTLPYTPEQKASMLYNLAMQALQNGDKLSASNQFQQILLQLPNHHKARLQLIIYYRELGNSFKVEELLTQGLQFNNQEPNYIKQMALLLNDKAEYSKALTLLLTMPKVYQNDTEYKQLLALTYFHEGFFDLAQKYYKQLLALEPNNSTWYLGLAIAQESSGEKPQALTNLHKARQYGGLNSETINYIQQHIDNLQQKLLLSSRSS